MKPRPKLAESFAKVLSVKSAQIGFWAYFPYIFLVMVGLGYIAVWNIPEIFWEDNNWSISLTVFSGLLAFNGLLMALGWFAFSKIYEILTNERMGRMIAKHDMLSLHLAFIDITHLVLIAASVSSVLALVLVLTDVPLIFDKAVFGFCLGTTLYGLHRAYSATKMMNDLVWEQSQVDLAQAGPTPVGGKSNHGNGRR